MVDIVGREFISLAKASTLLRDAVGEEIEALGVNSYSRECFSSDDDLNPTLLHYALMPSYTVQFFSYLSQDVYLCHPHHQSMKTSSEIFADKFPRKFPLLGADGVAALALKDKQVANAYIAFYFDGPFANISLKTGRVSAPPKYKFPLLTMPSKRRRFLQELGNTVQEFSPEFRAFCTDFSGWYVGFDEEDFKKELKEHIEWRFISDIHRLWSGSDHEVRELLVGRFPRIEQRVLSYEGMPDSMKRSKGRPRIPNLVERFSERWPLGLEEVTLSHAARVLGCDRKTLRSALEEVGIKRE